MIYGLMMARKNSTRLPNKNILDFGGMPLFEFSAREVIHSQKLDKIIVISDDERIWAICDKLKLEWIAEPDDLANQNNSHLVTEFVVDFLDLKNDDLLVYIPSTAPLRETSDIDNAIELFLNNFCSSVVSVRECRDPPEWSFLQNPKNNYLKFNTGFYRTSQERKKYYCLNGAIYIARVGFLKSNRGYFGERTLPYIMNYSRSINIDEPEDYWCACQYLDAIKKVKLR